MRQQPGTEILEKTMARLTEFYRNEVIGKLTERSGYSNPMQAPKISHITINMGVGEAVGDRKVMDHAVSDMAKIAGQQPIITKARKSVASFKIRDDYPIGCKVTLRRERMYEFLDRLINISLPRVRDFRGLPRKSFDGRGNYNLGIREQIIFPEIDYDQVDKLRGMDIAITTTANTDEEGFALLETFGFPFRGKYGELAMAQVSMSRREGRREKLVDKHASRRAELKKSIPDPNVDFDDKQAEMHALNRLPRDSAPVRKRNRCRQSGRPRGVYRKFGLGRNKLRKAAMRGDIPGLRKSSW